MPSISPVLDTLDGKTDSRRPVILHVITRMVKGGAQEDVLDLAERVDPSRYDSILVTGPSEGPEGSLVNKAVAHGADLREIPWLVREISPVNDIRAYMALVRLIRREKPVIVHTHTSKAGIVGRLAARTAGVPVVIHSPHGHVFHGYYGKFKTRLFIGLERWCARFSDRLVMITENERADHVALKIAPPEKFVTIHSGVDFDPLLNDISGRGALRKQFSIAEDARVIGTVGRLVPIKGQVHLIDAMPEVIGKMPNTHLVLVGSGPLLEELQNRTAEIGMSDHVHFAGYRSDVAACLKDMDLFVLPSLNEGMGRVLVEAMVMRLPSVASDVCGIKDLIQEGKNGRRVPVGDSDALAAAIVDVLSDPVRARQMGDEGFNTVVPSYGLEAMLTEIESMYSNEIERATGKADKRPGLSKLDGAMDMESKGDSVR